MTASTISAKGKRIGTALLAAAFWLLVWQGISLLVAQELLVPAPLQVARTLGRLAGDARFWQAAGGSLLRVAVGFAAALAAGSLLAVLTVRFRAADVLEGGEAAARPGQVVKSDKHSLLVQTGDGILSVRELQMEGKKRMDIESFLRGYPVPEGAVFERRMTNS